MTTAITFSRQNDAGSRLSNIQYWENLVLVVVLTEQCVTEAGKFLLQQQDKLHKKTGLLKKPYKQPFFVNEYKFEVGWQSSSLSSSFLDFAEQNILNILANPAEPYSTTSYEYVNILTLGGL